MNFKLPFTIVEDQNTDIFLGLDLNRNVLVIGTIEE